MESRQDSDMQIKPTPPKRLELDKPLEAGLIQHTTRVSLILVGVFLFYVSVFTGQGSMMSADHLIC
jgi:hypothetical protein